MKTTARDIMVQDYHILKPDSAIEDAVSLIFKGKIRAHGYKTVSALVIDEVGQLVGVLSMFDLLYHLRPAFLNYIPNSVNFYNEDEFESNINTFKQLTVAQVMSSPVRYIDPDVGLLTLVDIMVKEKCRRLPVLENSVLLGVVYLSEVYYYLCKTWLKLDFD
jgi:CBS domain-containing protein